MAASSKFTAESVIASIVAAVGNSGKSRANFPGQEASISQLRHPQGMLEYEAYTKYSRESAPFDAEKPD
jgi:hypothetical protein